MTLSLDESAPSYVKMEPMLVQKFVFTLCSEMKEN